VAVTETVLSGPAAPAASAAAPTLHRAALAAIQEHDQVAGPDQYIYVRTDSWAVNGAEIKGGRHLEKLVEVVSQNWVPTERSRDWLLRGGPTGRSVWLVGSDAEAKAAGLPATVFTRPGFDVTAACGDFAPSRNTAPSCADPGIPPGWQNPTPAWLAGLPTDPQGMASRLRADATVNSRGDAELVVYVNDVLQTGLVPARVRAVLYQALALLPDLTVTQKEANLAGRVGVAIGVDDPTYPTRDDIIIDPGTGQYIGERTVQLRTRDGIKAGTVTEFSAVSTSVADRLGEQPK
jgi:hypothetical protein